MIRFFNPGKAYTKIQREVLGEIRRVLKAGKLVLQEDGDKFEKTLAEFCGTKYAIGLNSGTDALYLSLWALGVGRGDKVYVPSHTFVATAQVVAQLGALPVLYDDLPPDYDAKAIIVAHIAGEFMCDMGWVENCPVPVIEDACQALGATQSGKKAGSFGVTGCFSFYPAKILGAYGDAGGLVTNDENLYNEIKELRNHYKKDYSKWGINSRLDNIQAAVLNVKMGMLEATLARRKQIAEMYLDGLVGVGLPNNTEGRVWQDFIITVPDMDGLYNFLKDKGIETMKNEYHFPIPKTDKSTEYESHSLRLPINEVLTDKEIQRVIKAVNKWTASVASS